MLKRLLISCFAVTAAISLPVSAGGSATLDLQAASTKHMAFEDASGINSNSKTVPIVQPKFVLDASTSIPTLPSEKDSKSPKLQSLAFTLSCIGLLGFMAVRRFKRAFV